MNPIIEAARYAEEMHRGQERKYHVPPVPYFTHVSRVAQMVMLHRQSTEEMVVAAYLHDVVEDTAAPIQNVETRFGVVVATFVEWLTNPSKGSSAPRAERKKQDREHLARAPDEVKIIKLLDRIDNLRDLERAPVDFKKKYAEESILLTETIGHVDPDLDAELINQADDRLGEAEGTYDRDNPAG